MPTSSQDNDLDLIIFILGIIAIICFACAWAYRDRRSKKEKEKLVHNPELEPLRLKTDEGRAFYRLAYTTMEQTMGTISFGNLEKLQQYHQAAQAIAFHYELMAIELGKGAGLWIERCLNAEKALEGISLGFFSDGGAVKYAENYLKSTERGVDKGSE